MRYRCVRCGTRKIPRLRGYGRLGGSSSSSSGGNATEGAVISQVPALQLAKTNLILNSNDLSQAAWTATATVTANTTKAPNGATQAATLNDTSAVATQTVLQAVTIPNDSKAYTGSCYFTLGTSTQAQVKFALSGGTAVTQSVDFNPANGNQIAASGPGSIAVTSVVIDGTTWFRVACTATNNTTGNTTATLTISPASNGVGATGTVIAWGGQIEQNNGATDLIQTDIAPLARRAGSIPPYLIDHSFGIRNVATNYSVDPVMDNGRLIVATTSVTLTLPALASGGPGFTFWTKNAGTGTLTINATTATELIRVPGGALAGSTSYTFPYSATTGAGPWNVSGGAFTVAGDNSGTAIIWEMVQTLETHGEMMQTTNGSTFTVPVGVNTIWVDGAAGGGGGGASATSGAGGGGAGGASAIGRLITVTPGATHNMTIGTGGVAGSAGAANNGSNGGSTALGAILTLPGGTGGNGAVAGAGGAAVASVGEGSGQGGGGMIPGGATFSGGGGGTFFAQPTPTNTANPGLPGLKFGGGGSGGGSGGAGGAGANGFLRIRW